MREYLTPEDIAIAEKNGITESLATRRFYSFGWSKKRAITQARRRPNNIWAQYKDICIVSQECFYQRIRLYGMAPEEAATTPQAARGCRIGEGPKITQADIEEAARNGISKGTLKYRVSGYKWSVKRAKTEPIHTKCRRKEIKSH